MARSATKRPAALMPARVSSHNRRELLPWNSEMAVLLKLRRDGATYSMLADMLSDRYGIAVNPQAVRTRVAPHITEDIEVESAKARERLREERDKQDAQRLATWLMDHPAAMKKQAGLALAIPMYRVEELTPLARTMFNGYLIPPVTKRRQQFSDDEMLQGIKDCAAALGVSRWEPLAQSTYGEWRKEQKGSRALELPSPIAYRRRFETWTRACELAGVVAPDPGREYDGLSVQDIVVHLAGWLRSLAEREQGLVDASQPEYREYLRSHPEAPSEELIRLRGTWASLLSVAVILEKTMQVLPKPKPVGTEGRRKDARTKPAR